MNEKERIIELVRQNVITMEEALVLLEAGTKSTDDKPKETKKSEPTKAPHTETEPEYTNTKKDTVKKSNTQAKPTDFGDQVSSFVTEVVDQSLNVAKSVTDYVTKITQDVKMNRMKDSESSQDTRDYSQEYREAQSDVEKAIRSKADATIKDDLEKAEREQNIQNKIAQLNQLEAKVVELERLVDQIEADLAEKELSAEDTQGMEAERTAKVLEIEQLSVEMDSLENEIDELSFNDNTTFKSEASAEDIEAQAARVAEKSSKLSAAIDNLNEELTKKQEALTIAQQRLREIEIFEELDELTAEMSEQKERLTNKVSELTLIIKGIEVSLAATQASHDELLHSQTNRYKENFRTFVDEQSGKVTEVASQLSSDAVKEGKKFGKFMSHQVKEFIENFNTKEVNLSVNVPWVKTQTLEHTFVYDAANVTELDFVLKNGSLTFVTHDKASIEIESKLRFHGQHTEVSVDQFIQLSTISAEDDQFIFHVNSTKLSMDGLVKLPQHLYNKLNVTAVNGDLQLSDIEAKEVKIENKNGDIRLKQVTSELLDLDLLNGDVKLAQTDIRDISLKNLNGDFRLVGNVGNIVANTVNADFFITKKNYTPSNIKIEGVNGDIKIATPEHINLEVECKTNFGDVRQRLSNVSELTTKKSHVKLQRIEVASDPVVKVSVSLTSGDVFLKDTSL